MKASVSLDGATIERPCWVAWRTGGFAVHFEIPRRSDVGKALCRAYRRKAQTATYRFTILTGEDTVVSSLVDAKVPELPSRGGVFVLDQDVDLTPERP